MSGFHKGPSSIDKVIALATHVKEAKARRQLTIANFIDIKLAYDCMLHGAISTAMRSAGISGCMYDWICNLRGRSIYMCVADGDASQQNVTRGVPQGGVLSPTLFILSLVGLERFLPVSVKISMYADDIRICFSGHNQRVIRARLQRAINYVKEKLTPFAHITGMLSNSAGGCSVSSFKAT